MATQTFDIRRLEPEDYRAIQTIHAQPKAIWGTLQLPYPSAETWRKRLAEHGEDHIGLVACADATAIGVISLHRATNARRRHVADIGMAVHDAWHGRGIGTALLRAAIELADRWMNLTRLELTVYTDNTSAIELYEKHGFEIEGTLRRYSYRDGEYCDAHVMARLR